MLKDLVRVGLGLGLHSKHIFVESADTLREGLHNVGNEVAQLVFDLHLGLPVD